MNNINQSGRIKDVFKSNGVIISLYIMYFILLSIIFSDMFSTLLIVHIVLICLSLTPLGEVYIRFVNGVRKIEGSEEKELLTSMFQEVYESALEKNPSLSRHIEIFISYDDNPNAFACGSNTICVTESALEFFDEEELKGILAHELGHINHWDTKILMVIIASNFIFSFIAIFIKMFFFIGEVVLGAMSNETQIISRMIIGIKNMVLRAINFVLVAIMSFSSRSSERMADEFAYNIGYGEELKNGLETLRTIAPSSQLSITEALHSSHPNINERIERLEKLENAYNKVSSKTIGSTSSFIGNRTKKKLNDAEILNDNKQESDSEEYVSITDLINKKAEILQKEIDHVTIKDDTKNVTHEVLEKDVTIIDKTETVEKLLLEALRQETNEEAKKILLGLDDLKADDFVRLGDLVYLKEFRGTEYDPRFRTYDNYVEKQGIKAEKKSDTIINILNEEEITLANIKNVKEQRELERQETPVLEEYRISLVEEKQRFIADIKKTSMKIEYRNEVIQEMEKEIAEIYSMSWEQLAIDLELKYSN